MDFFNDCKASVKTPGESRASIQRMLKAFNEDKVKVDSADFQLFMGLCEVATERFNVINQLSGLRSSRYSDESEQPTEDNAPVDSASNENYKTEKE